MVYIGELCVSAQEPVLIFIQAGLSCKWADDSQRLLLEWLDTIHDSPSQLCHLALPFCPSSSWIRKCYATELAQGVKVIKGLLTGWGTCSHTTRLNHCVLAITCWNNAIAVSLASGNIVILDGITGIQTAICSGHTDFVLSLAFSSDGRSLVSGSGDKTIKLWDMQTGGIIKTFHGHTKEVTSVSISADCTMIASGSWDKTVCLWNIQAEECCCIIEQQDKVYNVLFSPIDPQHLVSVSSDKVWYWDTNGCQTNPAHNGSHIAFSLDGMKLAFCQGDEILVQDVSTGATVAKLNLANDDPFVCCLSPDGKLLAGNSGNTAYIWDTTSSHQHPIKTFVGHTSGITSLAFSSSFLISSSLDESVKFWTIGALQTDLVVTESDSTPLTSAWIKSITLQTEEFTAISSDSEGMVRTWDISTGLCMASFQTPAKSYRWSDIQLVSSGLLFIWYENREIHMWDVEKGEPLQLVSMTLDNACGPDSVEGVRISGDGSMVFCLCWRSVQAWSVLTGEAVGRVGLEICDHQRSLSINGSKVWVHSPMLEPMGWDFGIPGFPSVQLSSSPTLPSKTKLLDVPRSRIINTVTGKVAFKLAGRFAWPTDFKWDGQYLVAGYEFGEVLILDFNHMFLQ